MATKTKKVQKLYFEKAMEMHGVSPLPHYYEEIYTNQIGLPALGIRGDKNYLYYSKNGLGAGYYEESEKKLAAQSVYDYFQQPGNVEQFYNGIDSILDELSAKTREVNSLNLYELDSKELARLFMEANELHGKIFSYYVVSQPYRMKLFEAQIISELEKRVATSRIDSYMAVLGASTEPTKITNEESDWLNFIIKYKSKYPSASLNIKTLKNNHPDMYADLMKHFENYKVLTLGDGNWKYNLKYFLHNLSIDYKKSLDVLKQRRKTINDHQKVAEKHRQELIDELYLNAQTIENLDFLAKMGHKRLVMRIEGWIPFIPTVIKLDIALSISLGHSEEDGPLLNFMDPEEIKNIIENGTAISSEVLIKRIGAKKEFLILHDNGNYRIYYGAQAGTMFKELVPPINHNSTTELKGSTAVRGLIRGTACVYTWGDDIDVKMKTIQKHQILIAGQTRPAMMPIIRLAKGIVTDEGGVTSHAAIISRELGIPSVIGTLYATQVFKDGDPVELDADNGVVRKLS